MFFGNIFSTQTEFCHTYILPLYVNSVKLLFVLGTVLFAKFRIGTGSFRKKKRSQYKKIYLLAIKANSKAPTLLSALQINPALWQNLADSTPVTSCNSLSLNPLHLIGKLFLFSKLPSSSGTAYTLYPPLEDGNTA